MSKKKDEESNICEESSVPDPAPAEESTEAPPEKSEEEKLREELAAEKEKYLRLAAEYDNYRRRSARERENIYSDVKLDTVARILPVYDNLERALNAPTEDAAYRKGVEMTMNQLREVFAKLGVAPIEAVGQTFDPNLHNAVMHTEDESKGEGEIVAEFQTGFKLGDRVIRCSMVQVAN